MQFKDKMNVIYGNAMDKINKEHSNKLKNNANSKIKLNDELENSIAEYNIAFEEMKDVGTRLFIERQRAVDLINLIESLINSIANHPKSFDNEISEILMHREKFIGVCDFAQSELEVAKKSAMSAGGGIATGAAVASLAPSAAMWIATTFGTASTGTAISALSGAAATNAALAWLGGGALATGGGGIAAGNAFLALAGPVGWGIAGATILTSIALFTHKKIKNGKMVKEEIEKVKSNTETVREVSHQIKILNQQTNKLRESLVMLYDECLAAYGKGFDEIDEKSQMQLGILVNNTKSLSSTLGINIGNEG